MKVAVEWVWVGRKRGMIVGIVVGWGWDAGGWIGEDGEGGLLLRWSSLLLLSLSSSEM